MAFFSFSEVIISLFFADHIELYICRSSCSYNAGVNISELHFAL